MNQYLIRPTEPFLGNVRAKFPNNLIKIRKIDPIRVRFLHAIEDWLRDTYDRAMVREDGKRAEYSAKFAPKMPFSSHTSGLTFPQIFVEA